MKQDFARCTLEITLISRSSGLLSREQVRRRESCHAAICVWQKKLCILYADRSTLLNKKIWTCNKMQALNKFYAANQKQNRSTRPPWISLNFISTVAKGTVGWIALITRETRVTVVFILSCIFFPPSISCVSDQPGNLMAILVTDHISIWYYQCVYIF